MLMLMQRLTSLDEESALMGVYRPHFIKVHYFEQRFFCCFSGCGLPGMMLWQRLLRADFLLTTNRFHCTIAKIPKGGTAMAALSSFHCAIAIQQRVETMQFSPGLYCRSFLFG